MTDPGRFQIDPGFQHRANDLQISDDIGPHEIHPCLGYENLFSLFCYLGAQEHIRLDPRCLTVERPPIRRQKAPAAAVQLSADPCATEVDHGTGLEPSAQMHIAARRQAVQVQPPWCGATGQEQCADPRVPQIGACGQQAVLQPKVQRRLARFKVQRPVNPAALDLHTLWVRACAALAIAAAQHQVADQPGAHAAVGVGGVGGQPLFAGKIGRTTQPACRQQVQFQFAPLIRA